MHSLNPNWTVDGFHSQVATLAEIRAGSRVLDLGCGQGNSVPHLLARAGSSGQVMAADRDRDSLALIETTHHPEIAAGRLSVSDLDLARPLPFASASFDCVVCQNVIECVCDRAGALCEIHRILKPEGCVLIGHYDFDGVLIASDDRDLTRRLVHGYADHAQPWQDTSEGQMGRLLPGLMAHGPFEPVRTETVLFVELSLSDGSYARTNLEAIAALSEEYGIPRETAREWLHGLEARSNAGTFYYALPWTYVVARPRLD